MRVRSRQNLPWILLSLALFILIPVLVLVQKKMSGDGTMYASIAMNMAHGIGSLWHPVNSPSVFPQFYEHPPLGMFVNSLFFRVLGDNFIVERLYCFTMLLLSLWGLILIWRQLDKTVAHQHLLWLLFFCWVSVPLTSATYGGNAAELLLVVLTTFSVSFVLRSGENTQTVGTSWLFLASLCIVGAFFTNGLQAFFPMATPFIYHLVFSRSSWKIMMTQTILLIFFTAIILSLIFLHHPAYAFMRHYFMGQLIPTLTHARLGNGNYRGFAHFIGLWMILFQLLPLCVVMSVIIAVQAKKTKQNFFSVMKQSFNHPHIIFLLLIGLSASLPILISSRQVVHYFLQAFPFFILMCCEVLAPIVSRWVQSTDVRALYYKLILSGAALFVMIAAVIAVDWYGRPPPMLIDATKISKVVSNYARISVSETVWHNWNLHAYLYRYFHIDLTRQPAPFYLQYKTDKQKPVGYQKTNVALQSYVLWKRTSE